MFQVSTRTQYAIRALVHLANFGTTCSARIAKAQHISPKYLEGILGQLKSAGLVISGRGRQGGYRLAKDPAEVSMIEVVHATEGDVRPVDCVDDSTVCAMGLLCSPRRFWLGLKETVDTYLSSVTLGDLAEESRPEDHPSKGE